MNSFCVLVVEATSIERASRKAIVWGDGDTGMIIDTVATLPDETSYGWRHCPDEVSIKATASSTTHPRVELLR